MKERSKKSQRLARLMAKGALSIGALCALTPAVAQQDTLSLAGEWKLTLETPAAKGPKGETVRRTEAQSVMMPASLTEQGIGDEITTKTQWVGSLYDSSFFFNPKMAKFRENGKVKLPFFLTPESNYVGLARYAKRVKVPKSWKGQVVSLELERPHITSSVWVNGVKVGSNNSLSAPHRYDVTKQVKYGAENEIEIEMDNDPQKVGVGIDSHSVTDQTQGCWNGIVGRMELVSAPKENIESLEVTPRIGTKEVEVKLKTNGKVGGVTLTAELFNSKRGKNGTKVTQHYSANGGEEVFVLPLGEKAELWDEFNPALYRLTAKLDKGGAVRETEFGMREIRVEGKEIHLNGHRIFLRGTVENCNFPETGYPPMDLESWMEILGQCKAMGLNHVRFHSYCPPEAAFMAADRLGLYLQPEGPSWPNHGVSLGRGEIIDTYLMTETERMVAEYGNHPSFTMLCAGNEPRGRWVEWCSKFVDTWKARDSRRIYTGASVGGGWQWQPRNEYHVKAGARGLTWDANQPTGTDNFDKEISTFYDKATKQTVTINEPFVAHEMGQWCAFPDLEETDQYTGAYKAKNFEVFAELLHDGGMGTMARKFLMSSGKLQTLCYKYEIERVLRTKDYAGYQLLGANDYSGQGTALVGVLNVFWREKGYCSTEEFSKFCSPVVPLVEMPKFVFGAGEKAKAAVKVSNYAKENLEACVDIEIRDASGREIAHSACQDDPLKLGLNDLGGNLTIELPTATTKAQKFHVKAIVRERGVQIGENSWDYWVYPTEVASEPSNVLVTNELDDKAIEVLKQGGRVLLCAAGKVTYGKDVKQTYTPVFWNTSWFKMRPPHTTGSYINKHHPALKEFPTDDWTELQWWELVNKAQTMQMTELPSELSPIVQPIDTWFVSRKLSTLFEAKVLGGRLMVTSMDITSDLEHRHAARQLRASLLKYMSTEQFRPSVEVDIESVKDLFRKEAPVLDMFTKDSPDELKPKFN